MLTDYRLAIASPLQHLQGICYPVPIIIGSHSVPPSALGLGCPFTLLRLSLAALFSQMTLSASRKQSSCVRITHPIKLTDLCPSPHHYEPLTLSLGFALAVEGHSVPGSLGGLGEWEDRSEFAGSSKRHGPCRVKPGTTEHIAEAQTLIHFSCQSVPATSTAPLGYLYDCDSIDDGITSGISRVAHGAG